MLKPMVPIAAGLILCLGVALAGLYQPDLPRARLERAYPGTYHEVAGLRLRVRDSGPPASAAPGEAGQAAVILLHGFGASLDTWEPWAGALAEHFRVIRLDLPGFGLTGPDPGGQYTDARQHEVLAALMDKLGLASAALVGHSLGGRIAWGFAAAYPERVGRLVLIAPDGFASPGLAYGQPAKVAPVMRLLPYFAPKFLLKANLEAAYGDPARLTKATLDRYRGLLLAPGVRQAMLERMEQVVLSDPAPRLAKIRIPVLLLWGEQDAMIPPGNAQDYLRHLPDARLVRLPGLGHVPFEEDPEASLGPVREFLGQGKADPPPAPAA